MRRTDLGSLGTSLLSALFLLLLAGIVESLQDYGFEEWQVVTRSAASDDRFIDRALHVRNDPESDKAIVVLSDEPAGVTANLTWDVATGKGRNLVKLLDSVEPSQCGVPQSNFSEGTAFSEYGWTKEYQGSPKVQNKDDTEKREGWQHAAEKLKLSVSDGKNIQYDLRQTKNVTINGKSYRSSGGFYSNVVNTDGGIFALHGISPRAKGAHQGPPFDGSPGNELVPLQSWADLTFLEWVDACKGDEGCVRGLHLVVKCRVQNNVTDHIATQALGGLDKWKAWPGTTFSKKSQQYAALMGTPSGRGVAWLLLTRRQQLGYKFVERIDLWSEKDGEPSTAYYTFRLKDQPDDKRSPSRLSRSTASTAQSGHGPEFNAPEAVRRDSRDSQSSLIYDGSSENLDYGKLFASDQQYTYDKAQEVGGYLANLLRSSVERSCVQQSRWSFSDLSSNGWSSSTMNISTSIESKRLSTILTHAKLSMDDSLEHIIWEHNVTKIINGTTYTATHSKYDAIYGNHAIAVLKVSSPISESSKSGNDVLPPVKALSDVLWLQWESRSKLKKTDIKDLRSIAVDQTTNQYTSQTVKLVFGNVDLPAYPGKVFEAGSKELSAILASPHGQGVTWLLTQNEAKLGSKDVRSVQIWADGQPCLLFEISDYAPPNSSKISTKSAVQRADKHQLARRSLTVRADDWESAVTKGKGYLDMLNCGTGSPSEFTSYEDLATWGWKSYPSRPLRDELKASSKQAMAYLKVSDSIDEMRSIMAVHKTETTVDGKTYPATQGSYENAYGPQFIVSDANYGPRAMVIEEEIPAEGPFPRLEKQSDVMFLEYQHLMASLKKPLTGLKGLLRSNVVNEETLRTVAKALGLGSFDASRLPKWPGCDFSADSDEAAAIFASPNGRAPVWLLGTHKEQLGHKSISKITVFGESARLHLLFVFEEVVSDSEDDEDGGVPLSEDSSDANTRNRELQRRRVRKFPQALIPRAPDSDWATAVQKGNILLEKIRCGSGPQSEWTSYDAMSSWGWKVLIENLHQPLEEDKQAMEQLEIKLSALTMVYDQHKEETIHDGVTYPATTAFYKSLYGPELIVALDTEGPSYRVPKGTLLPKLEKLSDVWYLTFSRLMKSKGLPLDGLKGVMRNSIVNGETLELIFRALGVKTKSGVHRWPGNDFDAGSDEMAALLATPNGRGVAWLLINHAQLGRKAVKSVRVWREGGVMMLFVLEDLTNTTDDLLSSHGSTTGLSESGEHLTERGIAIRAPGLAPEKYQELVEKGKKLVSALQSDTECFAQSEFTNYESLKAWGWSRKSDSKMAPMKMGAYGQVYESLGASWEHNLNQFVTVEHDTKIEKDGKTYHRTGAVYQNRFNPSVIIAMNNEGPSSKGKKQRPPVTGDPNPYPALARLSDVLFLEYQRTMAGMKQPMEKLKGIWRKGVMNPDTKAICIQIASNGKSTVDQIPEWPGKDFTPRSDEFAALIASPNGVAVAYILLQHRQQLGTKTVTSARVWYEEFMLQILFYIGDVPQVSSRSLPRRLGNTDLATSSGKAVGNALKGLFPRGLENVEYEKLVGKGKALVDALQASGDCMVQSEWTDDKALATWGWYRSRKPKIGPVSFFTATKEVYDFVGASMENDVNHRAYDSHSDKKEIDGVTYYPTGAEFDNRYSPSMIIAENIYGADYQGKDQKPPVTGDPNPFPKLRFWSDVTFLEYQKFMRDTGKTTDSLKAIWHRAIINPTTRDLAARLSKVDDWTDVPDWPGKDFVPGSTEFAALIGSDNGKGVVFLLLQHREQLGSRSITKARVWKDHTLHILYVIEDTCAEGDAGSKDAPDNRLIRRLDENDSEKVIKAKDSGLYFLNAQRSSVEDLNCLGIKQSTYTELRQLRRAGWEFQFDRPTSVDSLNDEATFESWQDLHLDLSADGNHLIEYKHSTRTTGADGVIYYPTDGFFRNLVTEGGIAAMDINSPWYMGPRMNPPVDGMTRPFPPLKQWSDVTFLVYQDFCGGDPVNMKNLKGVLQHNVVNDLSREALQDQMGKDGHLDEDGSPKKWPGTVYEEWEDGFLVALGVPNGKGVSYLLATHREALGWKEIYKVRIFSLTWLNEYNILYYIRGYEDDADGSDDDGAALTKRVVPSSRPATSVDTTSLSKRVASSLSPATAFDSSLLADTQRAVSTYLEPRKPPPNDPTALQLRAPSNTEYEKARQKGSILACQLYGDISSVPQSTWTDLKSLEDYGWTASPNPSARWFADKGLDPALQELGISTTDKTVYLQYVCEHVKETTHAGRVYKATKAKYQNMFNVDGGAIIAQNNHGPDSRGPPTELPLKQYSDVVFLAWQKHAGDKVKNLKYVFRYYIVNPQTRSILQYVLDKRDKGNVAWPGVKIGMNEADGQAILGTPNGYGVAYLLAQHKEQLGEKVVEYVTIFRANPTEGLTFSLLFWIVDKAESETAAKFERGVEERDLRVSAEPFGPDKRSGEPVEDRPSQLWDLSVYVTWTNTIGKRVSGAVEGWWRALRLF